MARPLPVNLLFAGTGAVLLISGIQGKRIADVLKGNFGKLEVKNPAAGSDKGVQEKHSTSSEGEGVMQPVGLSPSTFAPSPTNLSRHSAPDPRTLGKPKTSPAPEQEAFLKREEEAGGPILP